MKYYYRKRQKGTPKYTKRSQRHKRHDHRNDDEKQLYKQNSALEPNELMPTEVVLENEVAKEQRDSLLERAYTQWQFGDWDSLAALAKREDLHTHPEDGKLSLLAAAGLFQQGKIKEAREHVQSARASGCSDSLVARVLLAGAYNSVGRAWLLFGDSEHAQELMSNSLSVVIPGADLDLLKPVRLEAQKKNIEMKRQKNSLLYLERCSFPFDRAERGFIDEIIHVIRFTDKNKDIYNTRFYLSGILKRWKDAFKIHNSNVPVDLDLTNFSFHDIEYMFVHVKNDHIPKVIKQTGIFYEYNLLKVLGNLHEDGSVIIDVGANLGNHTVFFAGVLKADVLAFEASTLNSALLQANIELNCLQTKVKVYSCALGAHFGTITIAMKLPDNYGSFAQVPVSFSEKSELADSYHQVEVHTIDSIVSSGEVNQRVSVLKVDVEGMELDVLQGAEKLIEKHKPAVSVECATYSEFDEIKSWMESRGYYVFDVFNFTPTFVFLNRESEKHYQAFTQKIESTLRDRFYKSDGFDDISESEFSSLWYPTHSR